MTATATGLTEDLRFERLERLGAGGMAIVWRALDRKLRREVALKELRDEIALSSEGLARFRHEAEAIARLSHPNVLAFHDAVDEGPRMVLVLELVRGQPLDRLLAKKPPLRDVVTILEKVARGVHHAHEQGVIHRDLKPSNVLVGDDGEPKVSDFGLAHLVGDMVTTLTKTGALLGTPAYMAPEQARGDRHAIDRRTDVWALGAILYETLAGAPPFRADSAHALVHEVIHKEPPEPRALRGDVPLDLQTIALKCLAKEQDRRYASALEVADELGRWLAGRPIEARPPSSTELLTLWVRRNRSLSALLLALAVAVAGAGVAWGLRLHERHAREREQRSRDEERLARERALADELDRRERAVTDEIARVRAGTAEDGAVDRVVVFDSERTVDLLEEALAAVTSELVIPTKAVYMSANDLTPAEVRAGMKPLPGLEAILDRMFATGEFDSADYKTLDAVVERVEARAARALPKDVGASAADLRTITAAAQRRAGEGPHRVGTFACEALGRLKRARSVRPIERFLGVIASEVDACTAGEAIARIGGDEALSVLLAASRRFGTSSLFWLRVGKRVGIAPPASGSAEGGSPPAMTAADYKQRGVARASAHELDGAIADLTSSIALDPKDPFAWYNRAAARFEKRDLDGALSDASRAVKLKPEDGGMLALRGNVRRVRGDVKGALADLDKAVELEPERTSSWIIRGQVHLAAGEPRSAIADLTSALALEPRNLGALNNRGIARKAARDFVGALADWTRAIELDPDFATALANRGGLRVELGDLDEALIDLERALELAPRNVEALANRGRVHAKLGDLEAAFADLDRVVQLAPRYPQGYWVRAQARKDKGDFKGAIADFERAHELLPRSGSILSDLATLERLTGDLDGALRDYERALALEPKNALIWRNRGVAHGLKGDRAAELADVTRALELDGECVPAFETRALARAHAADREGALADAERAVDLAPADPDAWYTRGAVKRILGDRDGAIADLKRSLELGPKGASAETVKRELRALEE